MEKITELANKIRNERLAEAKKKQEAEELEQTEILTHLYNEFKIGFADYLPILKEAGIIYSSCLNDKRYAFKGSYILFEKGNKTLKMDFHNRASYRYEYNPYSDREGSNARASYGKWDKEDFLIFIDENLLAK